MSLEIPRHIKYWQRCYKSLLPHHYTANDSSRLLLGYLIIAALDLLTVSHSEPLIPKADRPNLRRWVLSLQHRNGGFCGSPNHVLPTTFERGYDGETKLPTADDTENANIAATYLALLLLGILAEEDDPGRAYQDVERIATLRWLKKLQRPDGSFGEVVSKDGTVAGGRDMRYCYMAAATRWVLRGNESEDFDVERLVRYIRRSQTFDGGIGESSMSESHAGYAYCAIAALAMLDRAEENSKGAYSKKGISDMPALVHWLVARAFVHTETEDTEEDGDGDTDKLPNLGTLKIDDFEDCVTGFNGRLNKVADTCYAWWVSGSLRILDEVLPGTAKTISRGPARGFLLEKGQHPILGGFGKHPGNAPDVYHSYLSLAALATMAGDEGETGLGRFDAKLTIGKDAAARIERGRKTWKEGGKGDDFEGISSH